MTNKIIEVRIKYDQKGQPKEIAVLWQANSLGFVRATYANTTKTTGFISFSSSTEITNDLFQQISAFGMYIPGAAREKYFPGQQWDN